MLRFCFFRCFVFLKRQYSFFHKKQTLFTDQENVLDMKLHHYKPIILGQFLKTTLICTIFKLAWLCKKLKLYVNSKASRHPHATCHWGRIMTIWVSTFCFVKTILNHDFLTLFKLTILAYTCLFIRTGSSHNNYTHIKN